MKVAKRIDLKCFHHKEEMVIIDLIQMLANTMVVIILQGMCQINELYNLNLHNVSIISQAGEK